MWFTFAAVALLSWPVPDPHLVRPFDPPAAPWSAGHRGVDLAVEAGAPVRATAAGRVSYAGVIAGRGVVAVAIDGTGDPPLRVTYEPVRATVDTGQRVRAGQTIGVLQAEPSHCAPASCLHWGLRRGTAYLDPLTLSAASPSVLLPVAGVPPSGATHEPAGTGQPDTSSRGYTGPLLTAAAARVGARQAAPHGRPPPAGARPWREADSEAGPNPAAPTVAAGLTPSAGTTNSTDSTTSAPRTLSAVPAAARRAAPAARPEPPSWPAALAAVALATAAGWAKWRLPHGSRGAGRVRGVGR